MSRGNTVEPPGATTLTALKGTAKLSSHKWLDCYLIGLNWQYISFSALPDNYRPNNTRPNLLFKQQINDLAGIFEAYKNVSEERHKTTNTTLNLILETLNHLEAANTSTAQVPGALICSVQPDSKPLFSKPIPTPELIAIVSKVVSEAQSHVGKKKGGADDNSCKVSHVIFQCWQSPLTEVL